MGRAGEADRKRRHVAMSPTAGAAPKKQTFVPLSEEKKLNTVVLQFQNQKLKQKLEAQKIDINALGSKFSQLLDHQKSHDSVLSLVNDSWGKVVIDMESRSKNILGSVKHGRHLDCAMGDEGGDVYPEDALLSRILEKQGTTESSTSFVSPDENCHDEVHKGLENIFCNILTSFDDLNKLKHMLYVKTLKAVSSHGQSQVVSSDAQTEVQNLRTEVLRLHLKHKSLARELQNHRDSEAKNKATMRHLKGELETNLADLEEINSNLAILSSERDARQVAIPSALNREKKLADADKVTDKQGEVHDMESTLNELVGQSNSRMSELKRAHEERLRLLDQLSRLQSYLKNVKRICVTQPYLMLKNQLSKAKADFAHYQALVERLQVEKESLYWKEKEIHMKNELVDVLRVSSAITDFRISELEVELQRYGKEKKIIQSKLQEASKEPGRKEMIEGFKALVSSFPERMRSMQNQLAVHKETATDIHVLRACVLSLTNILDRKLKELENLNQRSSQQRSEIQRLQGVIEDLKPNEAKLKHFTEIYQHQSTDSREVTEARNSEIKAWAHVHRLQSSLDECNLELRVKVAIEAEAKVQQRLAASEAEIVELRQKLEASKRDKVRLTDVLKSKHEETDAYLSEIETIGQAYDDTQTQNQQLLQQVTEIDDYNIKLVLEGLHARQTVDSLLMEKGMLESNVEHTQKTVKFYDIKACRIEEQLKCYADHMQRSSEAKAHNVSSLENIENKVVDVRNSSHQLMARLEDVQSQVDQSRSFLTEAQIELETERFERRRVEENLISLRRKAEQLRSEFENSSVLQKLRNELKEYNEILKCSICSERRKEVVITKCYHLFCNPCIQKVTGTRFRKCPICAASFGANDVKPVYI